MLKYFFYYVGEGKSPDFILKYLKSNSECPCMKDYGYNYVKYDEWVKLHPYTYEYG